MQIIKQVFLFYVGYNHDADYREELKFQNISDDNALKERNVSIKEIFLGKQNLNEILTQYPNLRRIKFKCLNTSSWKIFVGKRNKLAHLVATRTVVAAFNLIKTSFLYHHSSKGMNQTILAELNDLPQVLNHT